MTPRIGPATLTDIPALHALVERAYRGEHARRGWTHEADLLDGQRTDEEALAQIVADPAQVVLLALVDEALRGCVHLKPVEPGIVALGMLAVDPAHQAGGIGRALIAAAEAHATRAMAARRMEMNVIHRRHELIAWYARRGYAPTGETRPFPLTDERFGLPRTNDLDFVVLAKPLGPG